MSTTSTELSQLIAQRDDLDRKINELRNAARAKALAEVRRLMKEYGLTAADIVQGAAPKRARKSDEAGEAGDASNPFKPKPKYRDESGNTWTGRGLQPVWLRTALEQNPEKTLENFLIKE